jgi:hypothetical protein
VYAAPWRTVPAVEVAFLATVARAIAGATRSTFALLALV